MIDKDIKRFCEVIEEINRLNEYLDNELDTHYTGGYTFEELNAEYIKELVELQEELKTHIKIIYEK